MDRTIYLDNAATTQIEPEVIDAMQPYLNSSYGNPSAIYTLGLQNKFAIERAREQVAALIHAKPEEIFFTSGGTEADNWALIGVYDLNANKGKNHIITTKIEHHAILKTCEYLEKYRGAKVSYIGVDEKGRVNPADVEAAITPETCLISVMIANNEIGTTQPVRMIARIAKSHGILFHSDAVQAVGHMDFDVNELGMDMLSASAHKFGGPKGVGFLYIKEGTPLLPFIHGGGQQEGMRSGTENVAGIVGLGKAAEIAATEMFNRNAYISELRNSLRDRILEEIPGALENGHPVARLCNNLNITIPGLRSEALLVMLDSLAGICVSAGSACASSDDEPSHVLTAIGLSAEDAESSLRFTLSHRNTPDEIDEVVDTLKVMVERELNEKIY